MSKWLVTILAVLFLSGCATRAHINERGNPENGLQYETEIAEEVEEDDVLAVVNGEVISIDYYNNKLMGLSNYERAMYKGEEGHQKLLKAIIMQVILVQKAKEMKLNEDAEVQKTIKTLIREMTAKALIEALTKQEIMDKVLVTDEEAKAYYDENKEEFEIKEMVQVRHIMVATEEEALEVRKQLEEGADFTEIAGEKSTDQITAKKGGELGYFERGKMVAELEEVCFNMKVGEISDPVKTDYGYHIVNLEDKKEAGMREFYEVSDDIKKKLLSDKQREEHQKWLNQLEEEAEIKIETAFGESNPESLGTSIGR